MKFTVVAVTLLCFMCAQACFANEALKLKTNPKAPEVQNIKVTVPEVKDVQVSDVAVEKDKSINESEAPQSNAPTDEAKTE